MNPETTPNADNNTMNTAIRNLDAAVLACAMACRDLVDAIRSGDVYESDAVGEAQECVARWTEASNQLAHAVRQAAKEGKL